MRHLFYQYHSPFGTQKSVLYDRDFTEEKDNLNENLSLLSQQISCHPDMNYYFMIPPYSLLWWDCAYVNEELEKDFYMLEQLASDDNKITSENYREKIATMRALADDITTDYIYDYYP